MKTCKICGDPVPHNKEICWCCSHEATLHKDSTPPPKKDGEKHG